MTHTDQLQCNWFGGEAVSLALNFSEAAEFKASGYTPFVVGSNATEYGEARQYGKFSFLRVYESGHEVPYYQPEASLAFFERTLGNLVIADGSEPLSDNYTTFGTVNATHTESFVPLPTCTGESGCSAPS